MGTLKLEREVQNAILLAFGALSWLRIWRQNTGKAYGFSQVKAALDHMMRGRFEIGMQTLRHAQLTTYGTPGAADIQGILQASRYGFTAGRFLAIEVKGKGGKQSEEQEKWQAMIETHGGLYILAYSVEDVWAALKREGYGL